jgi:SPP1 family predicted phage head-tail adaptor
MASRQIPAGQRNQLVTIQRPSTSKDALGQRTGAWVDVHADVWTRVRPARGRELFATGATLPETTVVFGMNYLADITPDMRVLWRGVPHAIVAPPVDVEAGRHTTELYCSAGTLDAV